MSTPVDEHPGSNHAEPARLMADVVAGERPLVIRGLCNDWPVVRQSRRSFSDFAQVLTALDNGSPVDVLHMPPEANGIVGYNAAMDGFNYRHFKVSITDVLTRLAAYSRGQGEVPGVALQSALISECMPMFTDTHPMPLLAPAVQPRLWIGNRVTTPAHFDASRNLAVVVCGRRRFTLFPAEQVANLYVGPLDFAPTGAAITMTCPHAPDFGRYPRLRDALDNALVAELEPGDAIYLPPLWWHQVESLEPLNALVNYWWLSPQAAERPPALGALLHARLAFAALPPTERHNWRMLFDHYVFGDADPAGHIPEARRGVLGDLDGEAIRKLREKIRSGL